jgi:hypothetical protein
MNGAAPGFIKSNSSKECKLMEQIVASCYQEDFKMMEAFVVFTIKPFKCVHWHKVIRMKVCKVLINE